MKVMLILISNPAKSVEENPDENDGIYSRPVPKKTGFLETNRTGAQCGEIRANRYGVR